MKTNSQLLSLSIKNFRSYHTEQKIDFSNKSNGRTITAFYGANASGKSNIALALKFIQDIVRHSNDAGLSMIPCQPFLLNTKSMTEPVELEVQFKQGSRHFTYGLSVTPKAVRREYLLEYASKTQKARTIFARSPEGLNANAERYGFGKRLYEATRPNVLLITKARENNNEYANIIFEWLDSLNVLMGKANETIEWSIAKLREEPSLYEPVLDLLKKADLWFEGFSIEEVGLPREAVLQLPFTEEIKNKILAGESTTAVIKTTHSVRDPKQKVVGKVSFDLASQESSGTQKFFELVAPIIDTLQTGKILYLDEFGSYLHPAICRLVVDMFDSSDTNKHNAQLILNTHDTSLMSKEGPLKRKDVYFVEKNFVAESVVSTLASRSDRSVELFEKKYREGDYGAIPYIGDVD